VRTAPVEILLASLLLAASCAGAAELGTLFSSPAERTRLDRLRRGEPAPQAQSMEGEGAHAITGYVKRSDGRGTVWVDGVPIVLANPSAAPGLDPRSVRAYSDRDGKAPRIERKPPG
jgi:hypothetical protein